MKNVKVIVNSSIDEAASLRHQRHRQSNVTSSAWRYSNINLACSGSVKQVWLETEWNKGACIYLRLRSTSCRKCLEVGQSLRQWFQWTNPSVNVRNAAMVDVIYRGGRWGFSIHVPVDRVEERVRVILPANVVVQFQDGRGAVECT